jgi:RNAse (barnase) inhibitor barstar
MTSTILRFDLSRISDRESFHQVFKEELGFPEFYGRNMDAWIDCMTSLDCPEDGLSTVFVDKDGILVLHLEDAEDFKQRCPDLFQHLVECAAFVNWSRIEAGSSAVLALSFYA